MISLKIEKILIVKMYKIVGLINIQFHYKKIIILNS